MSLSASGVRQTPSLGSDILQGNYWGEHAFRMINPFSFQRPVLLGPRPLPRKDTLWPPAPRSKGTASQLKVSPDLVPRGTHKINEAMWFWKVHFYAQPSFRNKLWSGQLTLFISSPAPTPPCHKVRKLMKRGYRVLRARHQCLPVVAAPAPASLAPFAWFVWNLRNKDFNLPGGMQ